MRATCDKCGKDTPVVFKESRRPRGVRETFFKCRECRAHYTCFVTDKAVRRKHKEIKTLRGTGADVTLLQEEVNTRMDILKQTFD